MPEFWIDPINSFASGFAIVGEHVRDPTCLRDKAKACLDVNLNIPVGRHQSPSAPLVNIGRIGV
jgi:hypothetical protein